MAATEICAASGPLACLVVLLVLMVVSDLRTGVIPDSINVLIALTGAARALAGAPRLPTLVGEAAAAAGTTALLLTVMLLARRFEMPVAMGGGDLKFIAAASLWVGVSGSLAVLFLASLGAVFVGAARARTDPHGRIAFAPMLAPSLIVVLLERGLLEHGLCAAGAG